MIAAKILKSPFQVVSIISEDKMRDENHVMDVVNSMVNQLREIDEVREGNYPMAVECVKNFETNNVLVVVTAKA